jgi:hypothetical protein
VWDNVFTFGKHRGQPVTAVPSDYLDWCLRECRCLRAHLREAIEAELARRHGGHAKPHGNGAAAGAPDLGEMIAEWYRGLCLKYHPDRGGSKEEMQVVNEARDRLLQLVAGRRQGA